MKNKQLKASIFTCGQGHLSLAQTVSEILSQNKCKIFLNQLEEGKEWKLYSPLHRYFPSLVKFPHKFINNPLIKHFVDKYAQKIYEPKIHQLIKKQKPHIIISTWFLINKILENYSQRNSIPFINIVSEPRTIIDLPSKEFSHNLIFDKDTVQNKKVQAKNLIISGWFVRSQFTPAPPTKQVNSNLKLNKSLFTILVIGGSEGTATISKILPAFINPPRPVQAIFICGRNKKLRQTIQTLSKIISIKPSKHKAKIHSIGYTNRVHKYIQSADLVIGKAGPNIIFESTAAHIPFMAITHVSGHEDGNLEIIKKYKLGLVEENPLKAIKIIRQIIKNPQLLNKFQRPIKKLAQQNKKAPRLLSNLLSQLS